MAELEKPQQESAVPHSKGVGLCSRVGSPLATPLGAGRGSRADSWQTRPHPTGWSTSWTGPHKAFFSYLLCLHFQPHWGAAPPGWQVKAFWAFSGLPCSWCVSPVGPASRSFQHKARRPLLPSTPRPPSVTAGPDRARRGRFLLQGSVPFDGRSLWPQRVLETQRVLRGACSDKMADPLPKVP